MNKIDINTLEKLLNEGNAVFICGNGFSMNFDTSFRSIYDNLKNACNEVSRNLEYTVKSNRAFEKKCKENYNAVKKKFRSMDKSKVEMIFQDGYIFAKSIMENEKLKNDIKKNHFLTELVFDKNELSLVESIYLTGMNKGIKYISIEHWPILIYMYYVINCINPSYYEFPQNNLFLDFIKEGNYNKVNLLPINETAKSICCFETIVNGFNNFYKFMFLASIFGDGKAIDISKLNKVNQLSTDKLNFFLNKFKSLMTLNYDYILENLTGREVDHLHGKFIVSNDREYVYNQSSRLKYENQYISFSDIIIGDYFINKNMVSIINNLNSWRNINKKIKSESYILEENFKNNKIETVVLFGLNINDDETSMRSIILALEKARIIEPKIIYCYFEDVQATEFKEKYDKLNIFGKELTDYGANIEIKLIKTQEILDEYFYKNKKTM